MGLATGEQFPGITASRVGGGELTLPQDVAGKWTVLLFYRGHWCPYCRQQLLNFQQALPELAELGVEVIALSSDPAEEAAQTVERHRLTYPVLYGLDAREIGRKLGAFTNEEPSYINATGFILRPDGTVAVSVYSSGAIGRLVPTDTIKTIKNRQAKDAAK
jgi:peroxiredoxin